VDAVGFVFAEGSPRRLQPEEARAMRNAMEPLVDAVALFKDNSADEVRAVVKQVRPSLLQFHGAEDDAFCKGFGVPYIKGIPMRGLDPAQRAQHAIQLLMKYPGPRPSCSTATPRGSRAARARCSTGRRCPPGSASPSSWPADCGRTTCSMR
jgi:phosphoribosylanthranilate isomerase